MGLNLSTTLPTGVVASYFQIRNVSIDVIATSVTITVNHYLSAAAASAGDAPVRFFSLTLGLGAYNAVMANNSNTLFAELYGIIKNITQFSSATDNGADYPITQ